MNKDKKIKSNPSVILREEFDDWAVLFDPDTEKIFNINPISVIIWKLLDGKHTPEDIVHELHKNCQDMPKDSKNRVERFINELIKEGLAK